MVFVALAVVAVAAMFLPVDFGDLPRIGRNVSGSRSNRVLLATLLVLSIGGSSVFIFTAAAAETLHGLTPATVSWALSLNAVAGVMATRRTARRRHAALWLIVTAASALAVGVIGSSAVFFAALTLWGFAFWKAVPAILELLAERSNKPSERMGDAQAAMAAGRVVGPILGGAALGAGQFARLSTVGSIVIMLAAISVSIVEAYRHKLGGVSS
jgi:DHA1 family inner membrane transport protein